MTESAIDREITDFIEQNINYYQRLLGLPENLTIESNIEEANVDDAALVNLLIKLEFSYEIYFEDKEMHRTLYVTLADIKATILKKITRKEEFLWDESIPI